MTTTPKSRLSPTSLLRDLGHQELLNGFIGFLFAATGPVAIILSVGQAADLPRTTQASWVAAVFVLNGLLSVLASWSSRQPLAFFWTIPGTVVIGDALSAGATWPEVVGGYCMAAAIIVAVALSGRVERVMSSLPMPVVMAMVAGVFLPFGTRLVTAIGDDAALAGPMVVAYVAVSAVPSVARVFPPVLAALLAGAVMVLMSGQAAVGSSGGWLIAPVVTSPSFVLPMLVEVAIPLVVTILVVQNGQGMAVLQAAGHRPPMGPITGACGVFSALAAPFGGVSSCLAGPTNALIVASGDKSRQYAAAVWCGVLAMVFGFFAPGMVQLTTSMPHAFVLALAGLAMLIPLKGAFLAAFDGQRSLGALATFLVTVSGITFANIGSAFWGLVVGVVLTQLLDRQVTSSEPGP